MPRARGPNRVGRLFSFSSFVSRSSRSPLAAPRAFFCSVLCFSCCISRARLPRAPPFSAPRTSLLPRFSLAQWSPCLCAVERLVNGGRDRLNLCPQLLLDLVQVVTVVVRDQIDRHAEVPETPRPPEKSKLKFSIVSYGVRSQCKR